MAMPGPNAPGWTDDKILRRGFFEWLQGGAEAGARVYFEAETGSPIEARDMLALMKMLYEERDPITAAPQPPSYEITSLIGNGEMRQVIRAVERKTGDCPSPYQDRCRRWAFRLDRRVSLQLCERIWP